jgi:hypothetical protein
MDARQILVKGRRVSFRIKAIDAKQFIRPVRKGACWLEDPTANMTEALCFSQMGFATPEFLSQNFMVGNINAKADSFRPAIIRSGGAHAANITNFSACPHDALCHIKSKIVSEHSLHERSHEFAILWMYDCQVFLGVGQSFSWVKAMYLKKLTGPVLESSRGVNTQLPMCPRRCASAK